MSKHCKNNESAYRTGLVVAATVVAAAGSTVLYYAYRSTQRSSRARAKKEKDKSNNIQEESPVPKIFQDETIGPQVKHILAQHLSQFNCKESLVKVVRQIDFWYTKGGLSSEQLLELTLELAQKATMLNTNSEFTCPKVRFGKTELSMSIITCGGMRYQKTWMPDFLWFMIPPQARVLQSQCQDNVLQMVRMCLKRGINHFETARFYGTSEYQVAHALDMF
ncbi:hypothetical protein ACA910_002020 [Epithemia clementina (nom. ined.)]